MMLVKLLKKEDISINKKKQLPTLSTRNLIHLSVRGVCVQKALRLLKVVHVPVYELAFPYSRTIISCDHTQ